MQILITVIKFIVGTAAQNVSQVNMNVITNIQYPYWSHVSTNNYSLYDAIMSEASTDHASQILSSHKI